MAVCKRQRRIMHGRMQSETRRDKIGIESIIMVANIRQRHKKTEPYEAITSFFDQETIRQKVTLHHKQEERPG